MGMIERLPAVLDPLPGGRHLVNSVDFVINWARANSLWPLTYGTACCAIEMMAASMPRYDISRFGSEVFRATPRQADLIILAGTIVDKMVEPLKTLYEQLPGPKYVIAMGACTISGGPFFYDNYSAIKGADRLIPVDVFIPGCPPRPEALFYGLMKLQEIIKKGTIRKHWAPGDVSTAPIVNIHKQITEEWAETEKKKDADMAEARKKFKEENPDYKPFKIPKVPAEVYPEVPRVPHRTTGLSNRKLFERISIICPGLSLNNMPDVTPEKVEALPPDHLLDFVVEAGCYREALTTLKNDPDVNMNFLADLTAVDLKDRYEIVLLMKSIPAGHQFLLRVSLPKTDLTDEQRALAICPDASLPSIANLYPAANWHEREVFDLMGINFERHPDLRRILLKDDFIGHPLRKNFTSQHIVERPY